LALAGVGISALTTIALNFVFLFQNILDHRREGFYYVLSKNGRTQWVFFSLKIIDNFLLFFDTDVITSCLKAFGTCYSFFENVHVCSFMPETYGCNIPAFSSSPKTMFMFCTACPSSFDKIINRSDDYNAVCPLIHCKTYVNKV
jgi:hypothetical protein